MKSKRIVLVAGLLLICSPGIYAQPNPPAPKLTEVNKKFSEIIAKNLVLLDQKVEVSSERRRQAYEKLLEGQRYIWNWNVDRQRSPSAATTSARLAKQALQTAVELDPALAEGYTALAELAKNAAPYNIDDAILLANIAVKIDADNFGGHQILAQLYTFNSKLNRGVLDPIFVQKAIEEWKEVARLDPRNAEAFAFLSELYARTNKNEESIDALKSWLASAAPLNNGFYGRIFQGENLAPEAASVKLGAALIKSGQTSEAVGILSRAVADDPGDAEAVELLSRTLQTADNDSARIAVPALQQAVFASPENSALIFLLAEVQARTGKINDAAKIVGDATAKLIATDKISAANLQVTLGDIYLQSSRFDEAVASYQNALTVRGVVGNEPVLDEARDFAIRVFDKIIDTYKKAKRPADAKAAIERARTLLGKNDLFADKKIISSLQKTKSNEK